MQANRRSKLKRLTRLDKNFVTIYVLVLPYLKYTLKATLLVATLFLASALYVQQPPNPLRAVIALGSAAAISVTVTSALLLLAKVYDSNRPTTT